MLNLGTNKSWDTPIVLHQFKVTDEMLQEAMQGNVHEDIISIAMSKFKRFLDDQLDIPFSVYSGHETKAWVNRYDNTEMEYHTHRGAHLSSILYLAANGGDIVFHDPRGFAHRGYDDTFSTMFDNIVHTPKTGEMLVFPSFLYHTVRASDQFRISVPVDLYLYRDD